MTTRLEVHVKTRRRQWKPYAQRLERELMLTRIELAKLRMQMSGTKTGGARWCEGCAEDGYHLEAGPRR